MLMTITQAAKELSLSVVHCRNMIRRGRWPFYRFGESTKGIRIDPEEIKRVGKQLAKSGRDSKTTE